MSDIRQDINDLIAKHGVTLGYIDEIVYAMKGERILELKEQGLSYRDIGKRIGVAQKTVTNRYHSALKASRG